MVGGSRAKDQSIENRIHSRVKFGRGHVEGLLLAPMVGMGETIFAQFITPLQIAKICQDDDSAKLIIECSRLKRVCSRLGGGRKSRRHDSELHAQLLG